MEEMTNEDLKKASDRKFMTESRRAVGRIGKDDKIDTSKMKMKPDTSQQDLIRAYRFKNNVPPSTSDADVLKMIRQGTPAKNKMGAAKLPKKAIMELPTNVPRLMRGANLMNPDKADLNKDGKLSGYEKARGKAIEKSMKEQKAMSGLAVGIKNIKKAKTGISFLDNMQKDTQARKRLSSAERREFEDIANLVSPQQKKNLGKNLRKIQSLGGDAQVNKTVRKFIKSTGGAKVQKIAKKAGNPDLQKKQGFVGAARKK